MPELAFNTQFDPSTGRPVAVAPGIVRITGDNPGPFTFTGTNSFLIGTDHLLLVDPGPALASHRRALLRGIAGRSVVAILLTHTHRDHSAGASWLRKRIGAPVWFGGQALRRRRSALFPAIGIGRESDRRLVPDRVLGDGDDLTVDDLRLRVVATPGHAANHLAFDIPGNRLLLSGDHVMGWNSTVIAPPDGSLADYLASLRRLIDLGARRYLPAHGGDIADGPGFAAALLAHRQDRNAQIVEAVADRASSLDALADRIYPQVPPAIRPAALLTLQAHLEYLAEAGQVAISKGVGGPIIRPA